MSDSQSAILAGMYDTEEKKPDDQPNIDMHLGVRKIRRISFGAIKYDVPTLDYVEVLERKLAAQERIITTQSRILRRLENSIGQMKSAIKRYGGDIHEFSKDLENKLDRREF